MDSGMGEFLAVLRKSKGYTQQEVAAQLGVSNKTVSSWETGASCPDISMLPVLAELYGVTCDEIIRGRRITCAEDDKTAEKKNGKKRLRGSSQSTGPTSRQSAGCAAHSPRWA